MNRVSGPVENDGRAGAQAYADSGKSTVRSVVGLVAESNGGRGALNTDLLLLVAAMSAGMAGFNLVPARGLDGYGALESLVTLLYRRDRTLGRRARRVLSFFGTVSALLCAWLVGDALVEDLVGIIDGWLN